MSDPSSKWTTDARYFEYSKVANPIGYQTPKVPTADFNHSLHEQGESLLFSVGDKHTLFPTLTKP